jgi:hypothetical protein
MSTYISEHTRKLVRSRANGCCEYCQIQEKYTFLAFHIDHIISLKHDGSSEPYNLAWACFVCNNHKGSDIGSILLPDNIFIRLFNPRIDLWVDHFEWDDLYIRAKTDIGAATIKVLALNDIERVMERQIFRAI